MIEIRAHELAPENIGKPIKLMVYFPNEVYVKPIYQILTGFYFNNNYTVDLYCCNEKYNVANQDKIIIYDKDI